MPSKSLPKTWFPTGVQNLVRHAGGTYYARLYRDGKSTFKSLRTKTLNIAKVRLQELKGEFQRSTPQTGEVEANATFGSYLSLRRQAIERMVHRAPRTREFYHQCLDKIEDTCGALDKPIRTITEAQCEQWAADLRSLSASRFNTSLSQLKEIFALAYRDGVILRNPASGLKRKTPRPKELTLPSAQEFRQMVEVMKTAGGRFSVYCAEMVEFLAYSGCRREEAGNVCWRDCDLSREVLRVTKTKNGKARNVPMIADLKRLLTEMRERRGGHPNPEERVLKVRECFKALKRASEQIGCPYPTHHDLRHLFATTCIESGVDIPTISRWLGHQDGGALAMRVYGHLRDEHSRQQAMRVTFWAP